MDLALGLHVQWMLRAMAEVECASNFTLGATALNLCIKGEGICILYLCVWLATTFLPHVFQMLYENIQLLVKFID